MDDVKSDHSYPSHGSWLSDAEIEMVLWDEEMGDSSDRASQGCSSDIYSITNWSEDEEPVILAVLQLPNNTDEETKRTD